MSLLEMINERNGNKKVYMYIIVDTSGGMYGERIGTLNAALEESIPMFKDIENQTGTELYIKILSYSTGAEWHIQNLTSLDDWIYEDMQAGGLADLGAAMLLLERDLQEHDKNVCPVVLHFAYNAPTDGFEPAISRLKANPIYNNALKYTVNIEETFDKDVIRMMGCKEFCPKDIGDFKDTMKEDINKFFNYLEKRFKSMDKTMNEYTIMIMIEQPLMYYSPHVIVRLETKLEMLREGFANATNKNMEIYLDYVIYSESELKRLGKFPRKANDIKPIELFAAEKEISAFKVLDKLSVSEIEYDALILFMFTDDKSEATANAIDKLEKLYWYRRALKTVVLCGNKNFKYNLANEFKTVDGRIYDLESAERVLNILDEYDYESANMGCALEENIFSLWNLVNYSEDNHPGKEKCNILREIRQKIADMNGIDFKPAECHHSGPCAGTCPVCDDEIKYLDLELKKKKEAGEEIKIKGIAEEDLESSGILIPEKEINIACGGVRALLPDEPLNIDMGDWGGW